MSFLIKLTRLERPIEVARWCGQAWPKDGHSTGGN